MLTFQACRVRCSRDDRDDNQDHLSVQANANITRMSSYTKHNTDICSIYGR